MATRLPISPFIDETLPRFKLDEGAFMPELGEELAGLTLGHDLDALSAREITPVLEVLAGYAA